MARHPANAPQLIAPEALTKWPRPPKEFSEAERSAWKRLGRSLMAARTVTLADLLAAEECCRVMAKVAALYEQPDLKPSTLRGWVDLQGKLLGELGLNPKGRKNIAAPGQATAPDELKALLG